MTLPAVGLHSRKDRICRIPPSPVASRCRPSRRSSREEHYVSLGDSFTADWGVDPVGADQPSTGCGQSSNDYPHQVAANPA